MGRYRRAVTTTETLAESQITSEVCWVETRHEYDITAVEVFDVVLRATDQKKNWTDQLGVKLRVRHRHWLTMQPRD